MNFVQNFPAISILLCLFAGIISSGLERKAARGLSRALLIAELFLNGSTLLYVLGTGEAFVYVMGKFPAPWGNEIRAGVLEALVALFFCIIMLLSLEGGVKKLADEVEEGKTYLYYVLCDLLLSSLLALVYTNDLFTAYVFVEINTIAGCGLIMIRQVGRSLSSAIRYMIMSQLGSGLFLIGLSLLYDVTGHLLMSPAKEAVAVIEAAGLYAVPMLVIMAVISVGLAIKSGLYPFHYWIPDTYGYATPTASAILSGLVSKGYIFLLIKIFYRVLGQENVIASQMINVLFVFGLAGMLMGSVHAILEKDTRRMIAYSSVAQIGYIYMGIGLGTQAGMVAAVFHMFTHSATKALLFISAVGLYEVSGDRKDYRSLIGAGYRNSLAGIGFAVGALSMVGFPMLSGFISKLLFATSALQSPHKMLPTVIALAVSTVLNAVYFLRLVITLYTIPSGEENEGESTSALPEKQKPEGIKESREKQIVLKRQRFSKFRLAVVSYILLNLVLGLYSQPIVAAIGKGLSMFD